jgi:hypothetical protein
MMTIPPNSNVVPSLLTASDDTQDVNDDDTEWELLLPTISAAFLIFGRFAMVLDLLEEAATARWERTAKPKPMPVVCYCDGPLAQLWGAPRTAACGTNAKPRRPRRPAALS